MRYKQPFKQIDKDVLFDLYYKKRMPIKQICKYFNCVNSTIYARFKLLGWKFRGREEIIGRESSSNPKLSGKFEEIKDIYINEKKTCKELAELYGVTDYIISGFLKRRGVVLRQNCEAQVHQFNISKNILHDLYVNQKMSCLKISQKLKCKQGVIYKKLLDFNIKRRERYEHAIQRNLSDLDRILHEKNIVRITKLNSLQDLNNRYDKIAIKCLVDGHIWKCRVCGLLNGSGCPICKYKGEKRTHMILLGILENTKIERNYKLCNYIGTDGKSHRAFIDYYFKIGDSEVVIEYNGEQHYNMVNWSNDIETNKKKFESQLFRDKMIKKHCQKNNIKLIEIDARKIKKDEEIKNYIISQFNEKGIICL